MRGVSATEMLIKDYMTKADWVIPSLSEIMGEEWRPSVRHTPTVTTQVKNTNPYDPR